MAKQSEFDQRMQAAFDAGMSDVKVFAPLFRRPTVRELQADVVAFQGAIADGRTRAVAGVD
jgi:hypothetical protein